MMIPLFVLSAFAAEPAHFGAEFTTETAVKAETVLASPADYVGKTVRVEGRVADVCQKKGCWMVITHEDKSMRVLMKDHSFAVAKDAAGKACEIEGIVEAKEVDPETTAHFASESADPDNLPEKKAKEGVVYQMVATAVAVKES